MKRRALLAIFAIAALGSLVGMAPAAENPKPNSIYGAQVLHQGAAQYNLQFVVDNKGKTVEIQGTAWDCAPNVQQFTIPAAKIHQGQFSDGHGGYKVAGTFVTKKKIKGHVHGAENCAPKRAYVAKKVTGG
jgi:hypothetical protein